jgi:glycosyltransferase involved in cell wall biosynthesis
MIKLPISLVVITLNEEKNIERCIKSVPFASEVVIVDSGSQDQTVEIAKKLGAKVDHEKWLGFGPQKNLATQKASYDWILNLDADEALSPELCEEIQNVFSKLNPLCAYSLPRRSFHLGRWIRFGGWYPDRQIRLYHRQHARWSEAQIHEKVEAPQTAALQNDLLHWVFVDLANQVATNNRYSTLLAEQDFQKGKKFSLPKLILKPVSKFFECYFLKLGFLDGLPGFIIAVSAAYSIFLRWSKIWELQKK